ncbi:SDR family oxidoreductase [Paraburkholderia susongensis]|uniref:NAD(P)-dependent dehydrogenase, short-chain alcohol dehydrogenase family n=1 Tax=Paraburkholderia susongensis TaxID=1515439 RepID=A0A1X7IBL4_9BURK|nr:SDR family oxidoreductase [Paraburkholderia susongensis]SMG11877.1 NAD(P)-dependent dehydrogenase, short-chain alcohol dehydrogenase family [Paraburkholderia susongensis]
MSTPHSTCPNGRLAGKVAIVSGSTQGLGADIARALVAQGACVMTLGLGAQAGQAVADSLGDACRFIETDITDDAQIDHVISATLKHFGRLDFLINNACTYADSGLASTREQWLHLLNVNLVSAAIFAQKTAAHMTRGGVIVNLGSTGGKFGAAGRALYPASKAALQQFTRNLAVTLAPEGIRAVTVSPAWTWSPSLEQLAQGSIDAADRVGRELHPLGRVGRGHEIAQVIAFLCSAEASWITGVDIPVDGGFSILGPDQGRSPRDWFSRVGNAG